MCFHWEEGTTNSPPAGDTDANGVPDFVDYTASIFESSWDGEVGDLGYLAPLSDTSHDPVGDGRLDVDILDLDPTDLWPAAVFPADPNASSGAVPTRIVFDNDFADTPSALGPPEDLMLTVAIHELFHAVQGAYDFFDDAWLAEGTAAWMEEELFDDGNYMVKIRLGTSALTFPEVPVDYGNEGFQYGSVLFWRFLSEYLGMATTRDRLIIRRIWELAADASGSNSNYSLRAVKLALAERDDVTFRSAFADFGVANYLVDLFYMEGDDYLNRHGYPPEWRLRITSSRPRKTKVVPLDHLSNDFVAFKPGTGVRSRRARLRLTLDLPSRNRGSEATVIVLTRSGAVRRSISVELSAGGDAALTVPFGRSTVSQVTVAITNASTRFVDCQQQPTPFSCSGIPRDDGRVFRVKGTLRQ